MRTNLGDTLLDAETYDRDALNLIIQAMRKEIAELRRRIEELERRLKEAQK